jgi:hypothetical protein
MAIAALIANLQPAGIPRTEPAGMTQQMFRHAAL